MKNLIIAGLLACSSLTLAQRKFEKVIPVQVGQTVEMKFDDPELIQVHTWDKNEIRITGSVSINQGENDDAFQITVDNQKNVLNITADIKDKENIPRRIMIRKGDQDYYFKAKDTNDPAVRKFLDENGNDYSFMSTGIIKRITLEIYIPRGMQSTIDAKYGMVEITNFDAPLKVNATYGGVDATIVTKGTGDLVARTRFGEILTNLDVKFTPLHSASNGQWTEIKSTPGSGPAYEFVSQYGKVYLRKP